MNTTVKSSAFDTTLPPIVAHALFYASLGWHVFPAPLGEKKSHKAAKFSGGRNWGATRDPEEIRRDFEQWPDANVGIRTGAINNFFVVEGDTLAAHGKDGIASLAAMNLPDTLQSESPTGSIHYYFNHPGFYVTCSNSELAPGVDVKGDGGMVIAPPSVKPGVGVYKWRNSLPRADAPDWLLNKIKPKPRPERAPAALPTGKWCFDDSRLFYKWLLDNGAIETDDDWVEAGMVARLEFGDAGLELWEIMATQGGLSNESLKRWESFDTPEKQSTPDPVRLPTLFDRAHKMGWKGTVRESTAEMFRDVIAAYARGEIWSPPLAPPGPLPDGTPLPEGWHWTEDGEAERDDAAPIESPMMGIRSQRIDAASLEGKPLPDREWLVRDLIPAKNVTLLYGDGGTGKSLLALQLAAAVVTGTHFFGRLVAQGRVEFVTAEDSLDEMHRRLAAIVHAGGGSLGAMTGLHLTSLAEADALLAVPTDSRGGALATTALYSELEGVLAETLPAVLFLDTLADVYGGNEIIRAQARQFISMLRRLALRYGCTIIVLAHPSLAGMEKGTSGSTGWSNSVRSRVYLKRVHESDGQEPDEDARVLCVGKLNYGRVGLEIPMRWQAGVFVPAMGSSGDPLMTGAKAERVFLELLTKYETQGRSVGVATGANYAPKLFEAEARGLGVSKRALRDAMSRLLDSGRIRNELQGPPSRQTRRLMVSTANCTVPQPLI
jgi:RecA-family ATPase